MATERPRRDDLREKVEQKEAELKESEQHALAALNEASEQQKQTHTVTLMDVVEVEVKDEMQGHVEKKAFAAQQKREEGNLDEAVDAMCDVLAHICLTDGYTTPSVWKTFWDEHGTSALGRCMMEALRPYREKQEDIKNQHEFR